jgi:tRNA(fMet)-specific endonuclease VapC
MGLILDTSILIAAERGKFALPAFFAAKPQNMFFMAAITASELLYGVEIANTPKRREVRRAFVEAVLALVPLINFDSVIARTHARIWAELDRSGERIGAYDQLIAATAVACDHSVATLNRGEFERVRGLQLADVSPFMIAAR